MSLEPSRAAIRKSRFRIPCLPVALVLILFSLPVHAASVSKKYRFEKNKTVALDLAVSGVRAEKIAFELPSSVLRIQTANKARVEVANGSSAGVRVGLAIALFDAEGNLLAVGAGGNKGGHVESGESEEFSVFFYYVNERILDASTFQISLEVN